MIEHCDVCGREEPVVKKVNIYRGKVYVCQECGEAIVLAFAKKTTKQQPEQQKDRHSK